MTNKQPMMRIYLTVGAIVLFGLFLVNGCKTNEPERNPWSLEESKSGDLPVVELSYISRMFVNQEHINIYSDGKVFADRFVGTNSFTIGRKGVSRILKDIEKSGFFALDQKAIDLNIIQAAIIVVDGTTTTLTVRLPNGTNRVSMTDWRSFREYCPSIKEFQTFERCIKIVEKTAAVRKDKS